MYVRNQLVSTGILLLTQGHDFIIGQSLSQVEPYTDNIMRYFN